MRKEAITLETFVKLVGRIGVNLFRRHPNGSSYMLPDGRICAELWNGKEWTWHMLGDKDDALA